MSFWADLKQMAVRGVWGAFRRAGIRKGQIYRFVGKGKLTPQERQLLSLMRSDNAASPSPFRASEFWAALNNSFDDWLEVEGLSNIESKSVNLFFSGHVSHRLLYYASWLLYQNLKTRDRWKILETVPATASKESGLGYLFEGNYVSWDLLISIDALCAIAEVDDSILTQPVTVLDLGSGWGRIGYVLQSVNPKSTYIACDLPESLLISSSYLPHVLPSARVFAYSANRTVDLFTKELLLRDGGIRFCGSQDLLRFADKSIDFFINVASFQEMTQEQVDQYFDVIDRTVSRALYVQQYWNGLRMGHRGREIIGYEYYPFRQHWQCRYIRDVSFSNLYFEGAYTIP